MELTIVIRSMPKWSIYGLENYLDPPCVFKHVQTCLCTLSSR